MSAPQVEQTFHRYPQPVYNFSYTDSLLSGANTELDPETKYRRTIFDIIPPKVNAALAIESRGIDMQL